jgi:hypothetical protein
MGVLDPDHLYSHAAHYSQICLLSNLVDLTTKRHFTSAWILVQEERLCFSLACDYCWSYLRPRVTRLFSLDGYLAIRASLHLPRVDCYCVKQLWLAFETLNAWIVNPLMLYPNCIRYLLTRLRVPSEETKYTFLLFYSFDAAEIRLGHTKYHNRCCLGKYP